jgi:hypothetical protein
MSLKTTSDLARARIAGHLDSLRVRGPVTGLCTIVEITHFLQLKAHQPRGGDVGGQPVGAGQSHAPFDAFAPRRTIPLHRLKAVDDR